MSYFDSAEEFGKLKPLFRTNRNMSCNLTQFKRKKFTRNKLSVINQTVVVADILAYPVLVPVKLFVPKNEMLLDKEL